MTQRNVFTRAWSFLCRPAAMIVMVLAATMVMAQNPPQPQPGPEVKKLDYFNGNWKLEGDMKPGPMGPGGKFSGTEHNEWMPGNFFLVTHSDETGAMGSGKALGVYGYDINNKVYTFDEFSSSGETIHAKGTVSGDTWTWTADEQVEGKTTHGRFTAKVVSPTAYNVKFEMQPEGGNWTTLFEGKLTKTQ